MSRTIKIVMFVFLRKGSCNTCVKPNHSTLMFLIIIFLQNSRLKFTRNHWCIQHNSSYLCQMKTEHEDNLIYSDFSASLNYNSLAEGFYLLSSQSSQCKSLRVCSLLPSRGETVQHREK